MRTLRRYDRGITVVKIAISLPVEQVGQVRRAVAEGRAASVSACISDTLDRHHRAESMAALLADMTARGGEPSGDGQQWARDALGRA